MLIRRVASLARCYADVASFAAGDTTSIVDFCFTHPIKPLQVRSEFESLAHEVSARRPKTVFEIGTAAGGSLFLLCQCSAPDAKIISLDLPGGKWGAGYHWARIPLYHRFAKPGQKLRLLRGNSHSPESLAQVSGILGTDKLDLLFIDGDHSYEGVKTDFERFSPLVKKGGLIILHDIAKHRPELEVEVDRFWNEVKDRYPHKELVENHGQGWAGIGLLYV